MSEPTYSTDHVYDGIQEFDNPLPGWWKGLFWITIAFSLLYVYTAITNGYLVNTREVYQRKVDAELQRQFATLGQLEPDEKTLLGFVQDPSQQKWLAVGKAIYQTNCVSCHGRDGSGVSGPNMTDEHYLQVKTLTDIPNAVINGANRGAMPAWGNRLGTNEIVLVSSYVASLRGQRLNGRPAEGNEIPAWGAAQEQVPALGSQQ